MPRVRVREAGQTGFRDATLVWRVVARPEFESSFGRSRTTNNEGQRPDGRPDSSGFKAVFRQFSQIAPSDTKLKSDACIALAGRAANRRSVSIQMGASRRRWPKSMRADPVGGQRPHDAGPRACQVALSLDPSGTNDVTPVRRRLAGLAAHVAAGQVVTGAVAELWPCAGLRLMRPPFLLPFVLVGLTRRDGAVAARPRWVASSNIAAIGAPGAPARDGRRASREANSRHAWLSVRGCWLTVPGSRSESRGLSQESDTTRSLAICSA